MYNDITDKVPGIDLNTHNTAPKNLAEPCTNNGLWTQQAKTERRGNMEVFQNRKSPLEISVHCYFPRTAVQNLEDLPAPFTI